MEHFCYDKVKDPLFFQENRLPAHASFVPYASEMEALEGHSVYRYSLNGIWKFMYARNFNLLPSDFYHADFDCKAMDDIRVPAHMQMEGYDAPQYVNVQYPWDGHEDPGPDGIPESFNPVGVYTKYFTLPEEFSENPVRISFQGVESGLALWLNGHYVGYSEDSFTPSEFDLTPYLCEGENKLTVLVIKWTASSVCEDQDFFRFSGIFRDVYLYMIPKIHAEDIKIETPVSDDYKQATVEVSVKTLGKGSISCSLYDPCGIRMHRYDEPEQKLIAEIESEVEEGLDYLWQAALDEPKLWSAESPYLYDLKIVLKDEEGIVCEVITQKIGIRRFEMKDGLMCINGKRIVFKGVNRHEFNSISGRVPRKEDALKDVITMKKHNINAIRTSHYPDDSYLYELCDEYGLYMIAENNLESHGNWNSYLAGQITKEWLIPGYRKEWEPMMLDRVNSCYQRDKNHPAILIWSCGNESFGGETLYQMSEKFRALDPYRLVHYEGVFWDRSFEQTSDMESQMYTPVEKIKEFLAEHTEKPFICCEYTHAMGNSCGGMHLYTELTDEEPRYQGGFIWDYIDQSIWKKDRYGAYFQAYGGDFDDRPSDYQFSGNGIVYGEDREPSPKMQEVKFNYQNISCDVKKTEVTIFNKNLFVSTSQYQCVVSVQRDGVLIEKRTLATDVAPGEKKTYPLPVKEQVLSGEYVITVSFVLAEDTLWADAGYEIAFGQSVYKIEKKEERVKGSLKVTKGFANIGVKGACFEILFNAGACGISSYKYAGKELFKTVPLPNFWRAPVDNDCGYQMQLLYAQWKIASLYVSTKKPLEQGGYQIQNPFVTEYDDRVEVKFTYFMPTKPASECEVLYTVYGDGTVGVHMSYDPVKELGDLPEFGMMFKMDADYDHVKWYGNGPQETYADRKQGAKLGLYENQIGDNLAKYMVPQECGNKTDVRYAEVTDLKGRGIRFMADEMMNFSALPYTPHEMEQAMHWYELPKVHHTVVRVSSMQMGIAGDDSWGARPHPEYRIDISKKIEFRFAFKGI